MIFDNKCQIRSKMLLNLSFEQFLTYTFRYSHGSTYLSPELTCRHQWSKLLKMSVLCFNTIFWKESLQSFMLIKCKLSLLKTIKIF